jgi:hypothetical protein
MSGRLCSPLAALAKSAGGLHHDTRQRVSRGQTFAGHRAIRSQESLLGWRAVECIAGAGDRFDVIGAAALFERF